MPKFKVKISGMACVVKDLIVDARSTEEAWRKAENIPFSELQDLDLTWSLPEDVDDIQVYDVMEIKNGNV
jgi:hypothetical protein